MTKTECVLEIMESKGYITIRYDRHYNSVKRYRLFIDGDVITDSKTREEIFDKIINKMETDDKYIVTDEYGRFYIASEIYDYINAFISSGEEKWKNIFSSCEERQEISKHLENHTDFKIKICSDFIYNIEVQKKREEQEKKISNEALELLNNIL